MIRAWRADPDFELAAFRWKYGEAFVLALLTVLVGGTWWYRRRWL